MKEKSNGFFSGIRFKISLAFLLIVGLSFVIMAGSLSTMVGDFLFSERVKSDRAALQRLSQDVAPLLSQADTEGLLPLLHDAREELGGEMLVLDREGKVQSATIPQKIGTKLASENVNAILLRGQTSAFSVLNQTTGKELRSGTLFFSLAPSDAWVSSCTASLVEGDDVIGVLVLISPVQDMMQGLYALQRQMLLIFLLVAIAAIVCSLVFSRVITKPVIALTRVIQKMAKGNFSARVKVEGSGEMRHLAEAFNTMSEKVETLDDARNSFVSNASHELKTPLATMKIMIESLIYQPEMDKALRTEFLTDIDKEIDRLSAIVSDLLTLVKMDSNSIKLTRENLSIAALIKENAHRLTPMAEQRGQAITLSLLDPCDTYADRSKLSQVIYNLMENAVKYSGDGGQIRVTLTRAGREAKLEVSDDGAGIPKDALPHIFDRFYRVDKARSRETGGTGLGLSIVHQLVLLHGGTITVESEEGVGSTFTVMLPLHEG